MAYEFTENLIVEIPNVEGQLAQFTEAETDKKAKGLIIEVAAIHAGKTANHNLYSEEELTNALESWTSPYAKPVILNHDPTSEAVGRVMAAKMDKEEDGTPYTRLQLAITDPAAIEKVLSERYLTGSVGGKADEALCSICGENWAKASMVSAPCKHVRGKTYKGKEAHIVMKGCSFKEYSWVNMPADARSGVRAVVPSEGEESEFADDEWVRTARVFELSMDEEAIFELTESEHVDVLSEMTKKNASALHMQLKGAFLSALATEADDDEEEDILAVSESLSEELAATPEADEEDEEDEEETVVPDEDADETDPNASGPTTRPQAQEKPHARDIDPERSTGAPISRASDDSEGEVVEDSSEEMELNEKVTTLESRIEELEAKETALLEENAKLKAALKRGLVERVVDTKIALGIVDKDVRSTSIEEHLTRSASSLADSLKDLSSMTYERHVANYNNIPMVGEHAKSMSAKGSVNEPVVGMEDDDEANAELTESDKERKVEDYFASLLAPKKNFNKEII